ncbi:hypothetical protein ACH4E8_33095 [Streptomyces sp. NPDC017979]|uniref:hypothetical protein n=1 Tax=Streptomyces sp. NPDC017979 TaxID=3365024 RepID=UPI0037B65843
MTGVDFATLKALKPSDYENAADGYRSVADMARAAEDQIEGTVVAGMRKSLQGEAAETARGELRKRGKNFLYTQTECGLISTALNGFAFDLAAAKRKLDDALADAGTQKLTVNADGSVTYPPGPEKVDGAVPPAGTATGRSTPLAGSLGRQAAAQQPDPYAIAAQDIADRIATALA